MDNSETQATLGTYEDCHAPYMNLYLNCFQIKTTHKRHRNPFSWDIRHSNLFDHFDCQM